MITSPDLEIDTCMNCGTTGPGVRCLGGWWLCWKCDEEIKRVPGRTAGARIRDGLRELDARARNPG